MTGSSDRRRLGPYEIESEIGRGGMGQVFKATQPSLGRSVAVKVLPAHLAENREFVERFLREARATARLTHPGIVTIHDVGESEGTYYFAMEYLEGRTLEQVIRDEGPIPVARTAAILREVLAALGHAHAKGILHRDVKPSNIVIERSGRTVLTDFGIAWAASETRMTQTGSAIGSPDYMSPEHFQGRPLDQRSDLYALGVVMYQMLTGEMPFHGETPVSLAYQHVNEPVPAVRARNPGVPEAVAAVVSRLLAKDPAQRYGSAGEAIAELDRATGVGAGPGGRAAAPWRGLSRPGAIRRGPVLVAIAAVVVAVGLVVIALSLASGPRQPARPAPGGASPGSGALEVGTQEGGAPATPREPSDAADPAASGEPGIGTENAGADVVPPSMPPGDDVAATDASAGTSTQTGTQEDDTALVPPASAPETFTITSRPEGAAVTLDGTPLEGTTPLTAQLVPGVRYRLGLALAGHESTGFEFALEDLTAQQRADGTLHFPLASSIPPGTLALRSSYPVRVTIGGRAHQLEPGAELELAPGEVELVLEAPEVFFADRRTVRIRSAERTPLALPAVATITVGATPGYCRVRIDGVDLGYLPATVQIAVGSHEFVFDWENIGKTLTVTRAVRLDTGRVFVAAPQDGARR